MSKLDFENLSVGNLLDFMTSLLWKYCWCIPSAVYKHEPDISLFDHLKTTAAIAGCLCSYEIDAGVNPLTTESEAFCLIGGDISGIQNFIFDVLTQQGKVAKRLRARSLYTQLVSEIASHKVLQTFDLPLCNILSSAGGNF
jgi:CRISPR-associated protein Csm1